MKNSMTTTTASATKTVANVKITATDKYLTFRDGSTGKVIGKIAKGEGYLGEYDSATNTTKVYKSYYHFYHQIKINISEPDFVIPGDLNESMLDFEYENRNIKFRMSSCEKWGSEGYVWQGFCNVYCGK